jgi:hypothetical protein
VTHTKGKPLISNGSTQLWFPASGLKPLIDHCLAAPGHDSDPEHGAVPLLRLAAQGDGLFYLTTNAVPPLLVDAFDPASRQRVYAIGHTHTVAGNTYPAPVDRYGPSDALAAIPLTARRGPLGNLANQLHQAAGAGGERLVLTLHVDGHVEVSVRPAPRPAPAAQWRDARLELVGLPGVWPGQFVTNATHQGWLLPRFTRDVAQQIASAIADLAAAGPLPHPLTPVEVTDTPAALLPVTAPSRLVGTDPAGFFHMGPGWPWVSLDLMPNGVLMPYPGPAQPDADHAQLPTPGQYAFTGAGYLMWLDDEDNLVLRPVDDHRVDLLNPPAPPEYGFLDPDAEWELRAVEHALREATGVRPALTGLAGEFTPDEVEALIITAADAAAGGGLECLSRRQLELAHRAYALLLADADEPADDGEGGRS